MFNCNDHNEKQLTLSKKQLTLFISIDSSLLLDSTNERGVEQIARVDDKKRKQLMKLMNGIGMVNSISVDCRFKIEPC